METIASVSVCASTLPSWLSTLASLEITCRPCDTTRGSARTLPVSLVMGAQNYPWSRSWCSPSLPTAGECSAQPATPVTVRHGKVAAEHCSDCGAAAEGRTGKIDSFERIIAVDGPIDPTLQDKLAEIADKCPVHRTLEAKSGI